jgi:MFS transporter, PPP family, 3-phenylpropionic acid transporter
VKGLGIEDKRRNLWLLRAACFFQVFGFGIQWSFIGVWMKDQGLGEALIGIISSVSILLWLFCGLFWGRLADSTGRPDRIVRCGCLILGLALFYLSFCREPAEFILYAVLVGISLPMISTLMPLLAISVLGEGGRGKGYASYRIFGSLGYVFASLVMPRVLGETRLLFWAGGAALMAALVPMLFFQSTGSKRRVKGLVSEVLRSRELIGFLVAVLFFALAIPAIFTFTTVNARGLGADNSFIGLLAATQGVVALIALPLVGRGVDRFGARLLLVAAFIAQPLRALSLSFVSDYQWLLAPQIFHFFTWAGLEVSGVLFVVSLAPPGGRATAQAFYMGAQVLGNLLGSSLAGYLAEFHGYAIMYQVSSGAAAVGLGVFVGMLIMRRNRAVDQTNKEV